MSHYGWPYFNPEVVEAELYPVEFPVEHDIEYVGGIRVHRVMEFKDGQTRFLWACEHRQSAATPEEAAANCLEYCKEEPC